MGHALEIVRFAPDVRAELLKFCFTDRWNQKRPEAASVSELRRFIEEAILLDLKKAAFGTDDARLLSAVASSSSVNRGLEANVRYDDSRRGGRVRHPRRARR